MQLKEDLTLSTRGNRTVTEFLQAMKMIADELAIIDYSVTDDDLTLYLLNGLGPEFREIAAPIRARETSLKFEELHDLLVGHESYLCRLNNQQPTTFIPTANYTHRQGGAPGHQHHSLHSGNYPNRQSRPSGQYKHSPRPNFTRTRNTNGYQRNGYSNTGPGFTCGATWAFKFGPQKISAQMLIV